MIKPLFEKLQSEASRNFGITVLRILFGIVMLLSGIQKYGLGIEAVTNIMLKDGAPEAVAHVSGIIVMNLELYGGTLLILGLGTRIVALLYVGEFFVAAFLVTVLKEGWIAARLPLLIWSCAAALLFTGPGLFAIDNLFKKK